MSKTEHVLLIKYVHSIMLLPQDKLDYGKKAEGEVTVTVQSEKQVNKKLKA